MKLDNKNKSYKTKNTIIITKIIFGIMLEKYNILTFFLFIKTIV